MGYAILMRHGERNINHDSPLLNFNNMSLDTCCPEVWESISKLKDYDIKQIFASPYLRTRQTALLVQYGYYKMTGRVLDIIIDKRIGEYLNKKCKWRQPVIEDFDKETLKIYNGKIPLCRESKELMLDRVINFHKSMKDKSLIITHSGIATVLGMLSGKNVELDIAQFDIIPISDTENINLYD